MGSNKHSTEQQQRQQQHHIYGMDLGHCIRENSLSNVSHAKCTCTSTIYILCTWCRTDNIAWRQYSFMVDQHSKPAIDCVLTPFVSLHANGILLFELGLSIEQLFYVWSGFSFATITQIIKLCFFFFQIRLWAKISLLFIGQKLTFSLECYNDSVYIGYQIQEVLDTDHIYVNCCLVFLLVESSNASKIG